VTGNAGFVHNGANGNAVLRWWPVIVFAIVNLFGLGAIAWQVADTTEEVRKVKETMVTSREWSVRQDQRDDQIGLLRVDVVEVKRRLETVERAVR
jgi:hypothetical protein